VTDLTADPGVGDPAGIRRLADAHDDEVDDLDLVVHRVTLAAGAVLPPLWQGAAQVAFAAGVEQALADARTLRTGLAEHAEALRAYATSVEAIQDEQRRLERRREALEAEREAALRDEGIGLEARTGQGLPFGVLVPAAADRVHAADVEEGVVQGLWDDLVAERRRADRLCTTALGNVASLGVLSFLRGVSGPGGAGGVGGLGGPRADDLLRYLSDLSPTDLALVAERYPELLALLAEADPQAVHDWWATMDGADPWVLSPVQASLVAALPRLFGSLDGLPPHARVAANVLNAEARLRELRGEAALPGADHAAIERERQYLLQAVGPDATVQLYLFEPHDGNIIEMFGTLDASTSNLVTYVPGTYTTIDDFYGGGVQQVSRWLVESQPGTVAFVYKDGPFPGETDQSPTGLLEANDAGRGRRAGRALAGFQSALATSLPPVHHPVNRVAIGHSWGLAAVTSSEVAGAHYDHVISLAGAGMLPEWAPRPGTAYDHLSYWDTLSYGQDTGLVWSGNNPRFVSDFESHGIYRGPDDVEMLTTPLAWRKFEIMGANHSLVATTKPENQAVLDDLLEEVFE